VPAQQFHAAHVPVFRCFPGMPLRRGIVCADGVNLSEGHVRVGAGVVEPHGFEQQRQGFAWLPLDAIELRQVVPRPRVLRLARDPFLLFANVHGSFVVQRKIDHVFPPEGHACSPTRMSRTSMTLVLVGPVTTRSPKPSK